MFIVGAQFMVKPIHAEGNSLAIGRLAAPSFVDGDGGHPERDVEGAADVFRMFSIIPKGYLHAPWRNSW